MDPYQSIGVVRMPPCPLCRLKPDLSQNGTFLSQLTFGHSGVLYG